MLGNILAIIIGLMILKFLFRAVFRGIGVLLLFMMLYAVLARMASM